MKISYLPFFLSTQGKAKRPIKEQVLNVKSSFCSMRAKKSKKVMFTDMIGRFWLDKNMEDFNDWVDSALEEGCTHMVVGFQSNDYHGYWVKGFDFTGRESEWLEMLNYLLDRGLIPFIFYTSGDTFEELNNLTHRCYATISLANEVVHCMGFEMIGSQSPTISSRQWYNAMVLMRQIFGEEAVLAMHTDPAERCTWASARGYKENEPVPGCFWKPDPNNPGEGTWIENDDPSQGDEIGAMSRIFTPDILAIQTRHYGDGPSYNLGNLNDTSTCFGHMVEIADRFLKPGTLIPGLNRGAQGPDWFASSKKRPVFCIFETVCLEYAPGTLPEENAIRASHRCREIVPSEGCYRR